jgi:hypothetical protein
MGKKKGTTKAFTYDIHHMALRDLMDRWLKNNIARYVVPNLRTKKAALNEFLENANQKQSLSLSIGSIIMVIGTVICLFVWNNFKRAARQENRWKR